MARCHTLLRVTNLLINETMNRILSTILISLLCLCGAMAQPAAVKNVAKSVFALKAYDAEGKQIATSNGVFLSADGIAACPWSAVREASRVEVVDFNGKTYPVTHILLRGQLPATRVKYKDTIEACGSMEHIGLHVNSGWKARIWAGSRVRTTPR